MDSDLGSILTLEVPVIVCLGETSMPFDQIISWVPGAIVQLDKNADDALDLRVNNVAIAEGHAVKVGENFGIRISFVGDLRLKIDAMSARNARPTRRPSAEAPELQPVSAVSSAASSARSTDLPVTDESTLADPSDVE